MAGEIFISYRRADETWARLLHAQLRAEGVEAWYDAQIGAGQDWRSATAKALQGSRIFVLLFSAAAAQSEDIAKELAAAIFSKKLVVPVRIEDIQPSGSFLYELASRNWVNAFENTEVKLAELAGSLAKLVKDGIADESVIPFDRNAGVKAPTAKTGWHKPVLIAAAALAVIAAATGAVFWNHSAPTPSPAQPAATRVVVLPFDTLDGKADPGFGKAVAEQIISTLNDVQVQTVSREDTAAMRGTGRDATALKNGAEFVLNGSVQKSDKGLRVTAHLDHALTHATVWTANYDQAGAEPVEFQAQIAASVSDVVKSALKARADDPAEMNDAVLAIYLKFAEGVRTVSEEVLLRQLGLARQITAQAPNFARGYSGFAVVSALSINGARPEDAAQLRADAKKAATQALALDAKDPVAYLALGLLVPGERWAEREAAFRKGLSVVSDSTLYNYLAEVLSDVGRLQEALVLRRNAQTLDSLSPGKNASLARGLVESGHVAEGISAINRAARIWPSHAVEWIHRFYIMANFGHVDEARAMLDSPQNIPVSLEPKSIAARRAYLDALRLNSPAGKTAAGEAIRSAVASGDLSAVDGMRMFAKLGDVDSAFALARPLFAPLDSRHARASTAPLFQSVTDSMRRDPRFMPLAAQAGLVDYWTTTGKWPDFCAEPGLPYDCRAAAKALASPAR
jgi:TolB-like protein